MNTKHRFVSWMSAAAAAVLLLGCSSGVRLDETPTVESRDVKSADAAKADANKGSSQGLASSTVAPVDLTKGNGANANAAALSGRVVYFDYDSYAIKDEYRAMIEAHARVLAANKSKRMTIEGHTDDRGGREYNLALGQKRADAVAKSMNLLGAPEAQIEAVSFGKERPAVTGGDEATWAKNRRAELKDR